MKVVCSDFFEYKKFFVNDVKDLGWSVYDNWRKKFSKNF